MNDEPTSHESDSRPVDDWKRRRRLTAVFGEVLPDTTSDERDGDSGPEGDDDAQDRWLRNEVPPHHG